MDLCFGFCSLEFPIVVVDVNLRLFMLLAGDDVVCIHRFQNNGHSFFPYFIVKIGE